MKTILDTNVLLRYHQTGHPHQSLAEAAIDWIVIRGDEPVVIPQVLYEFYSAATRPPANNGLGLDPTQAHSLIQEFRTEFTFFDDIPEIYPMWEGMVETHQVRGKKTHDTRIVAAMRVHGIQGLCTFNIEDFRRYDRIVLIDPAALPT